MSDETNTPGEAKGDSPAQSSAESTSSGAQAVQGAADAVMRFEMPQRLLLIGSAVTFVLGFLPWYTFSSMMGGISFNGFDGAGWLFGLTSVVTVALMMLPAIHQAALGSLTQKNEKLVFLALAAATFFFGPLRMLLGGAPGQFANMPTESTDVFSAGKTLWFWLAFLAAGGAVFGAYRSLRDHMQPS